MKIYGKNVALEALKENKKVHKIYLSNKFKDEEILESKLVNKNEKGEFIDRFRKRLMFPIQDERGRFIAFGGRITSRYNT